MPPNSTTGSSKTFLIIALVLGLVLAGLAVVYFSMPTPENTVEETGEVVEMETETTETETTETNDTAPDSDAGMEFPVEDRMPDATVSRSKYRNGTYTANGTYRSPAGQENVTVAITLDDDTITSATFTSAPTNPTTIKMHSNFKAGFETLVEGKPIDQVALTVVNGSSLTPKGFMDALVKIKADAAV